MTIQIQAWNDPFPAACRGGAVSCGNFDGVHLGHAALLAELRRLGPTGPVVAVTFDPHPLQLLRPEQFQPLLTTALDRGELLQAAGADEVVILQTTPELLGLSAREFFEHVLQTGLAATAIAEGVDFRFGRAREGTVHLLADLCRAADIAFAVVPPLQLDGSTVSSSRVRATLVAGQPREATRLLGRPYHVRGRVAVGQRRGRTIGYPTANVEAVATLVPADGVYVVRATVDGVDYPGAANLGPNPTFGEQTRKLEVHLLDFAGDLYGRELKAAFLERLRGTRPFAGVEELTTQLERDVADARRVTES